MVSGSERAPVWVRVDPERVQPLQRGESFPVLAAAVMLAVAALVVCYQRGYLLLYGDAVAHLAIARRILDARWPGLAQLGGVWLPLPHLLMLPLIGNMRMWQTGLAAAPMSMLSYALSVVGVWRLSRRLMRLRWALIAVLFYALNPNLLYLATTAMTEALFLALLVWTVVVAMEATAALQAGRARRAGWLMVATGLLVTGQVFTRYDGWIIGAAVWCCLAWQWWKSGAAMRRRLRWAMVAMTVLCVAGPLLWFWYNAHFEGDWLDFMRGPYSAAQIERKTAPPGQHYREWHRPLRSLVFFTRCAQVDAAAWETGFGLMAASLWALWRQRGRGVGSLSPGWRMAWLLWVPLPFYVYSVAYGSVPIFIPQLYPHSYYNARYGMEMLPVLSVYGALAAERLDVWLRQRVEGWAKVAARLWQPLAMVLCVANCVAMMYWTPLVLKEAQVNARTRVALEQQLALVMEEMPPNEPVMMALSAHVGAVQTAGRTLRSMVSENDDQTWQRALAAPAESAAFVIALKGDPVAKAVAEHPQGLKELSVLCTTGQPCATIYQSERWSAGSGR